MSFWVVFGSLKRVTQRREIAPSSRSTPSSSANRSMLFIANSNVLPCQVTLMSAPARSARRTVFSKELRRSAFVQAEVLKKMRTSWGSSATTFASTSARRGGGPLIFA